MCLALRASGLWLRYTALQNLIPSFPWIAPHALHPGAIQGMEGIKFCHLATLQASYKAGVFTRLAIDEVHCCSSWGHDFRPDYKFLGVMKSLFPSVPILGLTATSSAQAGHMSDENVY